MEKKNNYLFGILGGFIGGLVASIPWVFAYVYLNMILSLLAIIIALGVIKGYQLFKGKITEKLPLIIVILSVLCVTISTFVIIPLLLMMKRGLGFGLDNLQAIYDYEPFVSAIIKDYAISLIFTFLGISGVVRNIKKQIDDSDTDLEKVKVNVIDKK